MGHVTSSLSQHILADGDLGESPGRQGRLVALSGAQPGTLPGQHTQKKGPPAGCRDKEELFGNIN